MKVNQYNDMGDFNHSGVQYFLLSDNRSNFLVKFWYNKIYIFVRWNLVTKHQVNILLVQLIMKY